MKMLLTYLIAAVAAALPMKGDALSDLRATLSRLPATTPVHGSIDITSTTTSGDDEKPDDGKATVGFDAGEAGLRVLYPKATLSQAVQEARAEALDPERSTPVRSGIRRVRPLDLANLVDGASALSVALQTAHLTESRASQFAGRAARLLVFKADLKLSKNDSKHLKKFDRTISVWLGDDGVPVGAEFSTYFKASMMLITFEQTQKETFAFARAGDRLVGIRHEDTSKSDGMGQHTVTRTTEVLRLE